MDVWAIYNLNMIQDSFTQPALEINLIGLYIRGHAPKKAMPENISSSITTFEDEERIQKLDKRVYTVKFLLVEGKVSDELDR